MKRAASSIGDSASQVSAVTRKQLRPKKAKMSNNAEQLKSQTQSQSDSTVSRILSDVMGFVASHTGRGDNGAAQSIQSSQSADDNEPMEANQNTESDPTSESDSDAVADLLKRDTENKKRIVQLESTVKQLSDQVAMLLAIVGAADASPAASAVATESNSASDYIAGSAPGAYVVTYAAAVKKPGDSNKQNSQSRTQKNAPSSYEDVVTAVFDELRIRSTRAKNVVVTGLPVPDDANLSDATMFTAMCEFELGVRPNIVSCRRLGRLIEGRRARPLLVVLPSAVEADELLVRSKHLRQAANDYTRQYVFINPDMTKTEAKAAYDARVRRRQLRDAAQQRPAADSSVAVAAAAVTTTTGLSATGVAPAPSAAPSTGAANAVNSNVVGPAVGSGGSGGN